MTEAPSFTGEIYLITSGLEKDIVEAARKNNIEAYDKDDDQIFDLFRLQNDKVVAVVDDTPVAARAAKVSLQANGAKEVVVYYQPLEALEAIPYHQPPIQVVFTDFNMPRMNGVELARRLRTGDRTGL